MTKTDLYARTRRRGRFDVAVRAALAMAVALGVGSSAHAGEGKWTVQLEAMQMDAYGHDQHVLTVHEIDLDSTPRLDDKRALTLDTDATLAYRVELQYTRRQWGWGIDLFSFMTSQSGPSPTAAADGPAGPIDEVVFEVADRRFISSGPSEVLYFDVLEDTDLAVWTADLYGIRTLAEKPASAIHLLFGLRIGDFDNDYRAVVGIQDAIGSRLDASSNYGSMMGPLVGLAGDVRRGRNYIKGYIGQSVILGSAELTGMSRDFTGSFNGTPSFFAQETFRAEQDVAIPITEFRIKWTYKASKILSFGVGANASTWWDVMVPPGVIPRAGGDDVLHENTIVLFGMLGAVHLTF